MGTLIFWKFFNEFVIFYAEIWGLFEQTIKFSEIIHKNHTIIVASVNCNSYLFNLLFDILEFKKFFKN